MQNKDIKLHLINVKSYLCHFIEQIDKYPIINHIDYYDYESIIYVIEMIDNIILDGLKQLKQNCLFVQGEIDDIVLHVKINNNDTKVFLLKAKEESDKLTFESEQHAEK